MLDRPGSYPQFPLSSRHECGWLLTTGEPFCFVEPVVDCADDVLAGWDAIGEERAQERVAVDGLGCAVCLGCRAAARACPWGGRGLSVGDAGAVGSGVGGGAGN